MLSSQSKIHRLPPVTVKSHLRKPQVDYGQLTRKLLGVLPKIQARHIRSNSIHLAHYQYNRIDKSGAYSADMSFLIYLIARFPSTGLFVWLAGPGFGHQIC